MRALRSGSAAHRPMLTRLSEITPRTTERCTPASPFYRRRLRPFHRLTTLMRSPHPERFFWPSRNQRFFCSRLRSGLLLGRLGMHTRQCSRSGLVLGRVESGVSRHQPRTRSGGARLVGSTARHWGTGHKLSRQSCSLIVLPKLVGLAGFVLTDDLGRRHEHAENLMSVAVEDARAGLRISRSTSGNILSNSSRSPSNSLLKNLLATEGAW